MPGSWPAQPSGDGMQGVKGEEKGKEKTGRTAFPSFPYPEPYNVQTDLMKRVYAMLDKGGVGIVESPTGTGKTLSLLCASLHWLIDQRRRQEEEGAGGGNEQASDSDCPDWVKDFEATKHKSQHTEQRRKAASKRRAVPKPSSVVNLGAQLKKEGEGPQDAGVADADEEEQFLLEDERNVDPGKHLLEGESESDSSGSSDSEVQRPEFQILYCSRTHSQLAQVVKELKRTSLATQVCCATLGSRKSLCVNDKVLRLGSVSRINEACLQLQRQSTVKRSKSDKGACAGSCKCPFLNKKKRRAQTKLVDTILERPIDIEDIEQLARKHQSCGYYGARKAALDADIVFLPYNSVLSRNVRETSGVRVKGSVVIIDEAHNIAEAVNNMHSIQLAGTQLQAAKTQFDHYYSRFKNMLSPSNARHMNLLIRLTEALLNCSSSTPGGSTDSACNNHRGVPAATKILTTNSFLSRVNVDNINLFKLMQFVRESKLLFKINGYFESHTRALAKSENGVRREENGLETEGFMGSLNTLMGFLEAMTYSEGDGRVFVQSGATVDELKLKFVMLNAAEHFESLVEEAHAVILAGGTLQPLEDLLLQVMPTIPRENIQTMSCSHVIEKDRLLTLTVPKGPTGKLFDFTHAKRSNPEMLDELGRLLVNVCKVIPDGVVCFFPSYGYADSVMSYWNEKGVTATLRKHKRIFEEPKTAEEVEATLKRYKSCIESKDHSQGGLLICIVGGKMSEGINFSDSLGRGVVVVGLPYPNFMDPELLERLKYQNQLLLKADPKSSQCGSCGDFTKSPAAREYMENICMKAVNQTIGRAIRHKGDYASILLVDHRYSSDWGPFRKLPAWIKNAMVTRCENFGSAYRGLVQFFRHFP